MATKRPSKATFVLTIDADITWIPDIISMVYYVTSKGVIPSLTVNGEDVELGGLIHETIERTADHIRPLNLYRSQNQ